MTTQIYDCVFLPSCPPSDLAEEWMTEKEAKDEMVEALES